ncbi:MAG: response regulator [Gammaproteobacteria bacterium]|nr:response regulator [Gammaproteobacteria bacterium]
MANQAGWLMLRTWQVLAALVLLFGCAIGGILWHMANLQTELVQGIALRHARLYSEALSEFRTLYTSEVVLTAQRHGIPVTHDYAGKDAIPLPATLSMLLGQRIGERASGANSRLYSPYPFPWRRADSTHQDAFEREAWEFLNQYPDQAYTRFEPVGGRMSLRYATADVMRPACVACHNTHPDSPRRGWKVGDVRGVLEISLPIDAAMTETRSDLRRTFLLLMAMALVAAAAISFVIGQMRRGAERLQKHVDERTAELQKEVAVRRRAEHLAEAANRAKSVFLANMSHEIRTPLNSVLGFAQILRRDAGLGEIQQQMVQHIEKAGSHLLDLINDILDISKIEAGAMPVHGADFDLSEMLEGMSMMFATRCKEKGLSWLLDYPLGPRVLVHGDVGKLRQILINLLGNAVKFTNRGMVQLRVHRQGERYGFEIQDSGPGIPPAEQARIFEPFHQSLAVETAGGTGLGLTIARRHVELLGGELALESEPGRGTLFRFSLVLPQAMREVAPAVPDLRRVRHLVPGCRVRALVVDDVAENREVLSHMLRDIGVEVREAKDGFRALELLGEQVPDIVFMDIRMPRMNGLEAMQRMRQALPEHYLPYIAISASSLRHEIDNCLAAGFDYYIAKPFRFDEIFDCLAKYLGVRFDYEAEPASLGGVGEAGVDFSRARVPESLRQRLVAAAEREQLAELKTLLTELSHGDAACMRLAEHLSERLVRRELDAILDLLRGLPRE